MRRLVTMQVEVQLFTENGLTCAGWTTGVNAHGLGARVNVVEGEVGGAALENVRCRVVLELPLAEQKQYTGEIVRVDESWVPGFQYFLAVRFDSLPATEIGSLTRFIQLRESRYFTEKASEREWYVFITELDEQRGPLTLKELQNLSRQGVLGPEDYVWVGEKNDWVKIPDFWSLHEPIAPDSSDTIQEEQIIELGRVPSPRRRRALQFLTGIIFLVIIITGTFFFLEKRKSVPTGSTDAQRDFHRSLRMELDGKYLAAVKGFSEVLEKYPGDPLFEPAWRHYLYCKAVIQSNRKQRHAENAIDKLLELVNKTPDNVSAHNNLGVFYIYVGKYPDAHKHLSRALTLDPGNPRYLYNMGTLRFHERRFEEAADLYLQVIRMTPSHFKARFNLGLTYLKLGKRDEAEVQFNRAVELADDPFELRNRRDALLP